MTPACQSILAAVLLVSGIGSAVASVYYARRHAWCRSALWNWDNLKDSQLGALREAVRQSRRRLPKGTDR